MQTYEEKQEVNTKFQKYNIYELIMNSDFISVKLAAK